MRDRVYQLRFTDLEMKKIQQEALNAGMPVSEYIRAKIFVAPIRSSFCDKIAKWFGR
jgi:hypothetical protein